MKNIYFIAVCSLLFLCCSREVESDCIKPSSKSSFNGVQSFDDYDSAIAYARCVNKPLFIFFTQWSMVSCRPMEEKVFTNHWIKRKLNADFVLVSLYVDDQTPIKDTAYSKFLKRDMVSLGDKYMHLQLSKYQAAATPFFAMEDTALHTLGTFGYVRDKSKVKEYLQIAYRLFQARQ